MPENAMIELGIVALIIRGKHTSTSTNNLFLSTTFEPNAMTLPTT
jgi:hypothetical protein